MDKRSFVGISQASRHLGVNEATLRLWTDEGKIEAFITPGGHRRYNLERLVAFTASRHKMLRMRDLAKELAQTTEIHRELVRGSPKHAWYSKLTAEQSHELLMLGQGLFNLMLRYLTVPAKRENTLGLARLKGTDFGVALARIGLSLTDSVETFIHHRSQVMHFISGMMDKNAVQSKRVATALPLVTEIMDEALVSMVAAHQKAAKRVRLK